MPRGITRTDTLAPPPSPQPAGRPNGLPSAPTPTQAVQTPTGLPYGEAGALQQAQAAVPLPAGGSTPPTPGGAPADMLAQMAQRGSPAAQMPSPQQMGMPGLSAPTERPREHVTTGLPSGPPPPPGAPSPPQNNVGGLAQMLQSMSQATNSAALSQLAARAGTLGQ